METIKIHELTCTYFSPVSYLQETITIQALNREDLKATLMKEIEWIQEEGAPATNEILKQNFWSKHKDYINIYTLPRIITHD